MTSIAWTHPSVRRLIEAHADLDPMASVEQRARELTLTAMEGGWAGPPYDPFQLAEALGIEVVARQDLGDARLLSAGGQPRIEFTPPRRPARVRFSVAHELGHFLFDDYAERTRYRDMSQHRSDDWQLELLCNVAAAEFLMPAGAFPIRETDDLSLAHLLDQGVRFGVSTEALLRRVVKLTDRPASLFAAARLGASDGFRIDYLVGSRAWRPHITAGQQLAPDSILSHCTAVGFSDRATERWNSQELLVQAVGVPPYPGDSFPRLVGLLEPAIDEGMRDVGLRYVRGDAAQPHRDGPTIIAHVVNDRAQRWGGRGFAVSLMQRFPDAHDQYTAWASSARRRLGGLHLAEMRTDLWIASLVAQAGYGDTPTARPRLRLAALRQCLEGLATVAGERQASVHMPLIGTGQGGTPWPQVRDLVLEELADRHVTSTVYVLPDAPMPEDTVVDEQLSLV
jgi:O-acetyl-ADP-ribose deacetylase (regulator of RNase III)